jgi:hypothetical protein
VSTQDSTHTTADKVSLRPGCNLEPHQDKLLNNRELGGRWCCHPKVAFVRAKKLGVPLLRINQRVILVRLSDVLKAEEEAAS